MTTAHLASCSFDGEPLGPECQLLCTQSVSYVFVSMTLLVQVGMMGTSRAALPLLLLLPPAQVLPCTQVPALSLCQASL